MPKTFEHNSTSLVHKEQGIEDEIYAYVFGPQVSMNFLHITYMIIRYNVFLEGIQKSNLQPSNHVNGCLSWATDMSLLRVDLAIVGKTNLLDKKCFILLQRL